MHDIYLIMHLLGLTMAVGTGFAMMALGIGTKDMELPDRAKFMLRAFVITKVGSIGFALLLLSGVLLIIPIWGTPRITGFVHAKLSLVAIMLVIFGILQMKIAKAKKENGGPVMATIPKFGSAMLFLGILTIIFAVLSFH